MYNIKLRRESVASVYRKTTRFLSDNTSNLIRKKIPAVKKDDSTTRSLEECQVTNNTNRSEPYECSENDDDLGERDLDYYLGVRIKEKFWRDRDGEEQIRKDYLINHCGITEEIFDKYYKKSKRDRPALKPLPKLKQVPFKIYRKRNKKRLPKRNDELSWQEKASENILKMFLHNKYVDSTSESYSEYESSSSEHCDELNAQNDSEDQFIGQGYVILKDPEGVRIKEVSEGRPCDNCPELCPGFIQHAWRMCLSLRQLEWADVCRRLTGAGPKETKPDEKKKTPKFPSRERNYAVRRKKNNNNASSHDCECCTRSVEQEQR